jgi:thioredoxin-related protein
MRIILLVFSSYISGIATAQPKNVKFKEFDSWKQVLELSKKQNKYILLDAVATWCLPCKEMETEVYSNKNIYQLLNSHFITVKIQTDETDHDTLAIRKWYEDVRKLTKQYKINILPTFVFISPSGELAQRAEGYHNIEAFTRLLSSINDVEKNLICILNRYRSGELNNKALLSVALDFKRVHEDSLATEIAQKFKRNWLDSQQISIELFTPELKHFIMNFSNIFNICDPMIKYLYKNSEATDSSFEEKGFSKRTVEYLIVKDIINPVVKPNEKYTIKEPEWNKLDKIIKDQFGEKIAQRLIVSSKIGWYGSKNDWSNVVKFNLEKLDNGGFDTIGIGKSHINNIMYSVVFEHSNDPFALNKGINYMERLLQDNPDHDSWIDTYANLLYKIGRKKEAVEQERTAIQIANNRKDYERVKEYSLILEKMKNDIPTWEANE